MPVRVSAGLAGPHPGVHRRVVRERWCDFTHVARNWTHPEGTGVAGSAGSSLCCRVTGCSAAGSSCVQWGSGYDQGTRSGGPWAASARDRCFYGSPGSDVESRRAEHLLCAEILRAASLPSCRHSRGAASGPPRVRSCRGLLARHHGRHVGLRALHLHEPAGHRPLRDVQPAQDLGPPLPSLTPGPWSRAPRWAALEGRAGVAALGSLAHKASQHQASLKNGAGLELSS